MAEVKVYWPSQVDHELCSVLATAMSDRKVTVSSGVFSMLWLIAVQIEGDKKDAPQFAEAFSMMCAAVRATKDRLKELN